MNQHMYNAMLRELVEIKLAASAMPWGALKKGYGAIKDVAKKAPGLRPGSTLNLKSLAGGAAHPAVAGGRGMAQLAR